MNDFKIQFRNKNDIVVLELNGYLDAHTAPQLESAIQTFMKEEKYKIIVNCKELVYISSAGLGVFMAYIEEVRKKKGDIIFTNMSQKIYNVFDLLGFPLLYEIYKEEQEAVQKFIDKSDK